MSSASWNIHTDAAGPSASRAMSGRKERIRQLADRQAHERSGWISRNAFYYEQDLGYLKLFIPPQRRVLDLGCGTGHLLAALEPARGVGIDFSEQMIATARQAHPDLEFHVGDIEAPETLEAVEGEFDIILLADTVGSLEDCQTTFDNLHRLCGRETRVVIAYFNDLWAPALRLAEAMHRKMPQVEQNWLSGSDIANILSLADFESVRVDQRQVLPKRLMGVGRFVNRFLGTLPGLRSLGLRSYVVARSLRAANLDPQSTSVVIPCRNEAGNISAAVERLPRFCDDLEVVFVEGHSTDNTMAEIKRVIAQTPQLDIKVVKQDGVGKGDAVRKGFDVARGDILMILDADLTTPPEDLPKFHSAITSGKGELVMGSRLVYPPEKDAMRVLNTFGNKVFSLLFSWLLNQRVTDTLCGTKALTAANYRKIKAGRHYFGDFDPFGDFDLIFGAAKLNLKILEIPVRYRARIYGTTQIARFRHGLLLARMVIVAFRKLKAV